MCEDLGSFFSDINELKEDVLKLNKTLENIDKSIKNQNIMLSIIFQSLDSNFLIKFKQQGVEL